MASNSLISKAFWADTGERVAATVSASLVATLGAPAVLEAVGSGSLDIPWQGAIGLSALMGVLTFLKAIAARSRGDDANASLISHPVVLSVPADEAPGRHSAPDTE